MTGNLTSPFRSSTPLIRDNPKFSDALNNRGFTYLVTGNLDAAESDFLTALALDPDAIQPLANLASLYFNTQRNDQARQYVEHLLKLEPNNPQFLQLMDLLNG